uniref:Uncharacterized protein n=1 Tax=Cyprinus carpio TaxID=7962 RepID=A0A8C1T7R4_CYPCA
MDRKGNIRCATSAGYLSVFRHSAGRTRNTGETPVQDDDTRDPVKQDQVWREFVCAEEKNWSFLMNFYQLGHLRTETLLPSSVSLYSHRVPNTKNQMFGSGLYTELGKELIHLDNLLTLTANHCKTKRNPEMQPC